MFVLSNDVVGLVFLMPFDILLCLLLAIDYLALLYDLGEHEPSILTSL